MTGTDDPRASMPPERPAARRSEDEVISSRVFILILSLVALLCVVYAFLWGPFSH